MTPGLALCSDEGMGPVLLLPRAPPRDLVMDVFAFFCPDGRRPGAVAVLISPGILLRWWILFPLLVKYKFSTSEFSQKLVKLS